MRIIEVRWIDSNAQRGWDKRDGYEKDNVAECRSVGYVLHDTPKSLTLVQSQTGGREVADAINIPRSVIVSRRLLSKG